MNHNINNFILVAMGLLMFSCQNTYQDEHGRTISIALDSVSNYKDIIKHQEIIALPNLYDAMIGSIDNSQVYDDYYLFRNKNDVIYIFKKDGTFVSNSKKAQGKGHGEYYICLAYSYNKYSKNVEIIVPDGIMFYDCNFKFLRKAKFKDKKMKSLMFNSMADLAIDKHLLFCPNAENIPIYYVYDSHEERLVASDEYPCECGEITMQQQCYSDDGFVAFPCMNYSFYKIVPNDYTYSRVVSLDFGKDKLKQEEYGGLKSKDDKQTYLLKCTKSLPLRTFKSGEKIACLIKEGPMRMDFKTLIINIKNKEYKVLKHDNGNVKFPFMIYFADNIIYACVEAEELENYVDSNMLDNKSKEIYSKKSTDESNYYIIKYYLKE